MCAYCGFSRGWHRRRNSFQRPPYAVQCQASTKPGKSNSSLTLNYRSVNLLPLHFFGSLLHQAAYICNAFNLIDNERRTKLQRLLEPSQVFDFINSILQHFNKLMRDVSSVNLLLYYRYGSCTIWNVLTTLRLSGHHL